MENCTVVAYTPGGTEPVSVAQLRDAIAKATEGRDAYGHNLHPSKDVVLRVGEQHYYVDQLSVSFVNGAFVFVLQAGSDVYA